MDSKRGPGAEAQRIRPEGSQAAYLPPAVGKAGRDEQVGPRWRRGRVDTIRDVG